MLASFVASLDRTYEEFRAECDTSREQHGEWLRETLERTEKQLLNHIHPTLDAPRSHHKPKPRGRTKGKLDAVSEDAEASVENQSANPMAEKAAPPLRPRGLSVRKDDKALGAKRKSNVPAPADGASEPKRAKDETKKVTRDQLLEINAQHQAALAASAAAASIEESKESADAAQSVDPSQLTVRQLRDELKAAGLPEGGQKKELAARLTAHLAAASSAAPVEAEAEAAVEPTIEKIEEAPAEEEADEAGEDEAALEAQLGKKRVTELKADLRKAGLDETGNKAVLVARLLEHLSSDQSTEESAEAVEAQQPSDAVMAETEEVVEKDAVETADAMESAEEQPMEESVEPTDMDGDAHESADVEAEADAMGEAEAEESAQMEEESAMDAEEAAPVEDASALDSSMTETSPASSVARGFDATVSSDVVPASDAAPASNIFDDLGEEGADEAEAEGEPAAATQQQAGWGSKMMRFFKGESAPAPAADCVESSGGRGGGERSLRNPGHALCDEMQSKMESRNAKLAGAVAPLALQLGTKEAALDALESKPVDEVAAAGVAAEPVVEKVAEGPMAVGFGAKSSMLSLDGKETSPNDGGSGGAVAAAKARLGLGLTGKPALVKKTAASEKAAIAKPAPAAASTAAVAGGGAAAKALEAKRRAEAAKARAEEQRAEEARKREQKLKEKEERSAAAAAEAEKRKKEQQEQMKAASAASAASAETERRRKAEEKKQQEEAAEVKRREEEEKRKADAAAAKENEKRKRAKEESDREASKKQQTQSTASSSSASSSATSSGSSGAVAPLPEGWREFKAPDGRSYYQKPDKTTTWERPPAPSSQTPAAAAPSGNKSAAASRQCSIEVEKVESSGDEDDDEEEGGGASDKFPSWTRSEWLVPRLNEQVALDGDQIFGQAVHRQEQAVDLGDIFGRSNNGHRYHRRTSSAHWKQDRLTSPEEKEHKRKMGWM